MTNTFPGSTGRGGNIEIESASFQITDGAVVNARTDTSRQGGNITVNTNDVTLNNGASITARSRGQGSAGNILINSRDQVQLTDSNITTRASQSTGGDIFINAARGANNSVRLGDRGVILLEGDSDTTTNSKNDGGDIALGGQGIIAFDDSDIITRSTDGTGGNITLSALFSETIPPGAAGNYDHNDQVDLNAAGRLASGNITSNDTSFIQNNLADLADVAVNADTLIANSCIARTEQGGTFLVTGSGGLPERPGQPTVATYTTGTVQPLPNATTSAAQPSTWKMGDPIVEPQGVFQLPDGRIIMSRNCEP